MSGWLLLGLPGAIYLSGLSEIWIGIGLVIGAYLNWLFVAKRLRQATENANNALTLPDYLQFRFADNTQIIRTVSAVTILIFFTFYVSSGLVGGAVLFEKVFGLDYTVALWLGALVIVTYTFIGGFLAVSWTDFFQGCLMLLALIILPPTAFYELGGVESVVEQVEKINPQSTSLLGDMGLLGFLSLMGWGLGYFGQPHILARFMAIRSADDVPKSRRIAMAWMTLSLIGALAVGLVGMAYFADSPLENSETVFIFLAKAILNPWIAGIIIAAILSAIMSTIDSQLLVCSSVIVEDFYRHWKNDNASQQELVWMSRIAVLMIALIALLIASDKDSTVLELVSYAWAGFGCAFGPVILLGLYWKKMTRYGAIAAIVTGGFTVVIWKQLQGGIFDLYEIIPGFVLAGLAGIVISLLTAQQDSDSVKRYSEQYQK